MKMKRFLNEKVHSSEIQPAGPSFCRLLYAGMHFIVGIASRKLVLKRERGHRR